jgi:hypothetical protein
MIDISSETLTEMFEARAAKTRLSPLLQAARRRGHRHPGLAVAHQPE